MYIKIHIISHFINNIEINNNITILDNKVGTIN